MRLPRFTLTGACFFGATLGFSFVLVAIATL